MKYLIPHRKWVVIGTTSSGKSTLGSRLAGRLGLDFIELDALHWQPNWRPAEPGEFRASVENAMASGGWVAAGNYSEVRHLLWSNAEAIVWLDYPFPVVFWRLLKRTIRRGITQEELWNGNREKFWWHLKLWSDDSLFHWLFKTYWRRKQEFPRLLALPEYSHLHLTQLKTPREAEEWLASLPEAPRRAES
jgi:adenylate kinase family enzyme